MWPMQCLTAVMLLSRPMLQSSAAFHGQQLHANDQKIHENMVVVLVYQLSNYRMCAMSGAGQRAGGCPPYQSTAQLKHLSSDILKPCQPCACRQCPSLTCYVQEVGRFQQLDGDAGEAVEEGAGQAAPPAALLHRVLRPKQSEAGRRMKCASQLWNEHLHASGGHASFSTRKLDLCTIMSTEADKQGCPEVVTGCTFTNRQFPEVARQPYSYTAATPRSIVICIGALAAQGAIVYIHISCMLPPGHHNKT